MSEHSIAHNGARGFAPRPRNTNFDRHYRVQGRSRTRECRTCLGDHDEEIHAATISVRQWFRAEVTKSFQIAPVVE